MAHKIGPLTRRHALSDVEYSYARVCYDCGWETERDIPRDANDDAREHELDTRK